MIKNSNRISINANRVLWILSAIAVLLILASIAGQIIKYIYCQPSFHGFVRLFYLDEEDNIPTAFSAFMLIFIALLLAVITYLSHKQKLKHKSKWAILSLGFLYMAYDEAFEVHESFGKPFKSLFMDKSMGIFFFTWVIPGIAIVVFLGLFFLKFLLDLPSKTRLIFIISGIFYVGGSIGFDLIGGNYLEAYGFENMTYVMFVTAEESLEMAGLILFIWGLLNYFATFYKELEIHFELSETQRSTVETRENINLSAPN